MLTITHGAHHGAAADIDGPVNAPRLPWGKIHDMKGSNSRLLLCQVSSPRPSVSGLTAAQPPSDEARPSWATGNSVVIVLIEVGWAVRWKD